MTPLRRILPPMAAAILLVLALATPALGHGPQSLPDAPCNAGTATAHGSLGSAAKGHEHIPHDHGFGCVHLNPTAAH